MQFKDIALLFGVVVVMGTSSSCKKDVAETPEPTAPTPVAQTPPLSDAKLKDSSLMYSRDLYLWYKQIPADFNAQAHADPNALMTAIRDYSGETGFTSPVDRWSYAIKKTEWDNQSMGLGLAATETGKSLGVEVFFRTQNDLRVKYVEPQSPAGVAGIRRGWRLTKLNGSTNITTANSNFIVTGVYENTSSTFTFQKPDGTNIDLTLTAASFRTQPVVLDSVYTEGSKKVGYLVFNSFLGDTTSIYNGFQRIFSRFSLEQVNELVIDLRYNGGGYVSVQQKLANYIINASNNGQVMMTEQFNDKYSRYNVTKRFSKLGTVNVNRVSFIVSSSTASASELLINNLKPYMDVRLVGPSKTHGKPVGFFPTPVGEWYVFPVSFRTVNKNGEGNYFNGLALNNQVTDGIDKDWGDRSESALSFILNGLRTGTYRIGTVEAIDPAVEAINNKFTVNHFKGAVDTRGMH